MRTTGCILMLALLAACKGASSSAAPAIEASASFPLTSTDFAGGATIPKTFTCDGENASPALAWQDAPAPTKSFALIVDDPDAPSGDFTHWIVLDIPAGTTSLPRGANVGTGGKNDFGKTGYGAPCPPSGKVHRYFFRLYALDVASLGLAADASRANVERAVSGHALGKGELMGTYSR